MRAMVLVVLLVVAPTASAFDEAELTELLGEARLAMKAPGLRAALRLPDGRVLRSAVGEADRKAGTPLTNDIGMPGGSTGKVFVAVLAMSLVEDEILSLDAPVARWLGNRDWFQRLPNADTMQVRHLLSHSSGIGDYPATVAFQSKMVWRVLRQGSAYFTPEELIAMVPKRRAKFPAGQGFAYTDAGYLVLGRLMEAATGERYEDLLSARVLEPLSLQGIRFATESALPDIATGYMGGGSVLKDDGRMKFDPRSEWTGGGLVTTPTQLVRFIGALAEGRIVRPETFRQMLDGGWRDPSPQRLRYGLGLFVAADGRSFGHGGRWPGYRTHVAHDLRSGVSVAVQTNRDGRIDLETLAARLVAWAVTQP